MSLNYQINILSLHDLPNIMNIGRRAYDTPWSAALMRDTIGSAHTQVWGVFSEDDMQCVGFGVLSLIIDEAELLMLCIDPEYQRQGYGHNLLEFLIAKAKESNIENFYLEVREHNRPATKLFAKSKFSQIGKRKDCYPVLSGESHGESHGDAVVMGLKI